jgi:hypothetical protein
VILSGDLTPPFIKPVNHQTKRVMASIAMSQITSN